MGETGEASDAQRAGDVDEPEEGAPAPDDGGGEGRRSKKRLIAVILLVLIGVAIAGVLWFRPFSSTDGADATTAIAGDAVAADVSVDGQALPPFEGIDNPDNDPALGMPAPTVEGTGLDGEPLAISPGGGTPTVLLFVAHWCSVCRDEVPKVQQAVEQGRLRDDVRLVAVSTGVREGQANFPPGDWFREVGWTVPTLVDSQQGSAAAAYGLRSYPYWVFVQGDGAVAGRLSGSLAIEDLRTLMGELAARR